MKHLKVGGSTAARTLKCPGWIKASENIPRRPAGQAAIDGSMHHEIMELCQKKGTAPKDYLGFVYKENGQSREFGVDDLDLSNIAHTVTNTIMDDLDIDQLEVEPFLQYIKGSVGGSTDLLGLSEDGKTLLSLDYKFGRNKVVAKNNAQLMFYPMCARRDSKTSDMFSKVEKLVLVIVQPQVKGVVDTWECSIEDLNTFETEFNKALDQVYLKTDVRTPGSHCNWCPAAPYCETKRLNVMASSLLGAKERNDLQTAANVITEVEDWLKMMKEEMYMQLNRGVALDGWKIIDKRATRKWIDDMATAKALANCKELSEQDVFKSTLLTPPAMEKVIKKKKVDLDLSDFIVSESSGTTLAPADHASPAVIVTDVQGHLKDIMK
tara:strand:+ start:552 stop:1691 length:1140 start_codon:yes stop_codon:yes gene_type:complete